MGAVVCFVLVLVAAVSGLVAAVGSDQLREDGWPATGVSGPGPEMFTDPVTVDAEVLDLDGDVGPGAGGEVGWASADVVFETEAGQREVVYVDLGEQTADSPPLPQVGDTIEVVYERGEPGFALRADDPALGGSPDGRADASSDPSGTQVREATQAVVRRSAVLALSSLLLAVLVGLIAVVAVRRAPQERVAEPPTVAVG
jgi:hypothetical protein